jgi:tRNA modification GTPase
MADTVFALSSGHPPSGVAVIRISGPKAFDVAEAIVGRLERSRGMVLGVVRNPDDGSPIDSGLVLCFPAPHSFTGEDVVELQLHGSRAVINALTSLLSGMPRVRNAEAGEFTRRAFENDKMDMTAVEGLSDLIMAETQQQLKLALDHQQGGLAETLDGWRTKLLNLRAQMEAEIDFADEEDVPDDSLSSIRPEIERLYTQMQSFIDGQHIGEIIRDGFRIALVGPPNVGKSSLLNALAKRDVAIVSDIAGTTRDLVEVQLNIGGFLVRVVDTAGIRDSADAVETEGINRSIATASTAHLVLNLYHDEAPLEVESVGEVLTVFSKSDLAPDGDKMDISVSAYDTDSVSRLLNLVSKRLDEINLRETTLPARARQVAGVAEACGFLTAMQNNEMDHALLADHLRSATDAIGKVTGRVDVEHLLDAVFSEFCVGK